MGKTRGPYNEEYPVGSRVRIVNKAKLEIFRKNWKYHHPLEEHQLRHSGETSFVQEVRFYHGGDELYVLEGIPGIWHEVCLERESDGRESV